MAATTLLAALDNMVKEELPALSTESLNLKDAAYSYIKRTSEDVSPARIGRGWNAMHRFHSGVSGLIEPEVNTGGSIYNDTLRTQVNNTPQGFPNPTENPHVRHFVRQIFLNAHYGNFSMEIFDMKVESLSAAQLKTVAYDLQGLANQIAHQECVSFYAGDAIGRAPATTPEVAGSTATTTTTSLGGGASANAALLVYPIETRMAWWKTGMYVDIYDDSSLTNKRNVASAVDVPLIVDVVDPLAGIVYITSVTGLDLSASDYYGSAAIIHATTDNYIVPRGQTSALKMGHYGLSDWMIASGTLFGDGDVWDQSRNTKAQALDVAHYPEFKSSITTSLGSPLTESILNHKLKVFVDAYQSQLDTIITTYGVTLKILEQPNQGTSRLNYDRTGRSLAARFGWKTMEYEWEGRTLQWLNSQYCPSNTLYAIKLGGGNIKRFVPPRVAPQGGVSGTGTMDVVGNEIEFIGSMTSDNMFMPVHSSTGRVQAQLQAPFWQFSQVAPDDVRGVKIAGITESS